MMSWVCVPTRSLRESSEKSRSSRFLGSNFHVPLISCVTVYAEARSTYEYYQTNGHDSKELYIKGIPRQNSLWETINFYVRF